MILSLRMYDRGAWYPGTRTPKACTLPPKPYKLILGNWFKLYLELPTVYSLAPLAPAGGPHRRSTARCLRSTKKLSKRCTAGWTRSPCPGRSGTSAEISATVRSSRWWRRLGRRWGSLFGGLVVEHHPLPKLKSAHALRGAREEGATCRRVVLSPVRLLHPPPLVRTVCVLNGRRLPVPLSPPPRPSPDHA